MSMKKDLKGKRFGKLFVDSEHHSDGKHLYWSCTCDCGNKKVICGDSLKKGVTKSCGCMNIELIKQRFTKHGKSNTRLYHIWTGIIYRCENPNAPGFKYWGGKGIKVCDEWRNSYENFYSWAITHGYSAELDIDRINPYDGYCPENCQWLTKSENSKKVWSDKKAFGVV